MRLQSVDPNLDPNGCREDGPGHKFPHVHRLWADTEAFTSKLRPFPDSPVPLMTCFLVFPLTEQWEPLAKIPSGAPKNSSPTFQESRIHVARRKSERQWKRQTLCQTSLPSNTDLSTPVGFVTLKK